MIGRAISPYRLLESSRVGLLAAALGVPMISSATGFSSFFDVEEGINIVGAGVGLVPDYQGSNDYTAAVAPFGRYHFAGRRYIQLLGPDLRLNLIDSETWRLGPDVFYRFGRDDDVDDAVVRRMNKIDDTVEVGAFLSGVFPLNPNDPRERLVTSADLKFDAGGTHNGWIATAGAMYWRPLWRGFVAHIGGRMAYASRNFMQTYYGVTGSDITLFPSLGGVPYDAGGGIHDVRFTLGGLVHLSPNWHLGVGARYQRLLGDAADSPVVDERGSKNQWVYGIGLGYAFQ